MRKGYKIFLGIIVGLLLMVSLGFNFYILLHKNNINNENCECKKCEEKECTSSIDETGKKLTKAEAEQILKELYNDAVRHIFNESVSYCGDYATGDNTTITLNGFSYSKSSTFKTFKELDNYLKNYMTESLLKSSGYNDSYVEDGVTIGSYYEKDGSLYCNGWNKGGNIELEHYLINESTFVATKINDNSFDGSINAVYSDFENNNKTTLKIKVSVVKQNDKWLLNSYKEDN